MRVITNQHIRWRDPAITVRFGFTGLTVSESISLARSRLREQFPTLDRPNQCVYVVRLKGPVAIDYGNDFSPVIYIGEGNAAHRLHGHANWIAELLIAVPNVEVEVRVADCVRAGDSSLCQYVEADLIEMFFKKYGCLPWFNRQRERKFSGKKSYDDEVISEFSKRVGKVSGSNYLWAIRPTHNNSQYPAYVAGLSKEWRQNA